MELLNTQTVDEKIRQKSWHLMEHSFPLCEQRPHEQHLKALADSAFHADIAMEGDKFIGIVFYWIYDGKYCFVEHLATDPALRNGGYGGRIMEQLFDKGYVIILEIDPPEDEISIRRKGFYERLGFTMNLYKHIHPSYRPTTKPHQLYIMSFPHMLSQEEFTAFRKYLMNHVMIYVEK